MTPGQLTPVLVLVIGAVFVATYVLYFRKRTAVSAAGGQSAYDQQQLDKYFGLVGGGERVTAAWIATTLPERSASNTAINVAGAVMGLATGTAIEVVGRPVVIACTTADRLLYMDKESRRAAAMHRGEVRITGTGRKGTKRTEPTTFGFVDGTVLAAPTLTAWSVGADVSRLRGPYAPSGTY
jgi:hypothetical protein